MFVNTLESSSVTLTKTRLYFIVEVFRPISVVKKVEMELNSQKKTKKMTRAHTKNSIPLLLYVPTYFVDIPHY